MESGNEAGGLETGNEARGLEPGNEARGLERNEATFYWLLPPCSACQTGLTCFPCTSVPVRETAGERGCA